jgi:RNA polymerase II subunit A C-terminal domain phosphatase SSU72
MDPRRARDPRLARADPRLPSGGTPVPNATAHPQATLVENGTPNHSTPPPPAPSLTPQLTALPQDSQHTPPVPTDPSQKPPPRPGYKPRPLFCVVCASNQVRVNT